MTGHILLLINTLGVGLQMLHHRMMARGVIIYPVVCLVSAIVAVVDGYAAWAHPEQLSFGLWSFLGLWGLWHGVLGWKRYGHTAKTINLVKKYESPTSRRK